MQCGKSPQRSLARELVILRGEISVRHQSHLESEVNFQPESKVKLASILRLSGMISSHTNVIKSFPSILQLVHLENVKRQNGLSRKLQKLLEKKREENHKFSSHEPY